MFRIVNKVFCSVFDDRNNTIVNWLANISNFFQKFKLKNSRCGSTDCIKTAKNRDMTDNENGLVGGEELKR